MPAPARLIDGPSPSVNAPRFSAKKGFPAHHRAVKTSAAEEYDEDPVNRRGGIMQVSSSDIQSLGPSKICLIGRTGREVELRETQTGKKIANVSLAVNTKDAQGEDVTDWFKLIAWEEMAVSVASVKKGTMIAVSGRPSINSWNNKETLEVTISDLKLIEK
eukprot:gene14815-20871_t